MRDRAKVGGRAARRAGSSAYRTLIDVVVTGIVVILPFVVTLYILSTALGFIQSALAPVIRLLQWAGLIQGLKQNGAISLLIDVGLYTDIATVLSEVLALVVLVAVILVVGAVGRSHYGERLIDYFDHFIAALPGIGAVYKSFRRMGDVFLENGIEDFQDVKLVEFPHDDVYVIGFETSTAPQSIQTAAGAEEMVTLFLPLAPNPVMGGFLTYIPEERVSEVDMTVEQAVRLVITSGIATETGDEYRQLGPEERNRLQSLSYQLDEED